MRGTIRKTQQELDPLGGIAARLLVGAVAVGVTLLSIALTLWHLEEVSSAIAALLAVGLVTAASAVAWVSTSPDRAPFTVERLALVVLLALTGAVAEYVSTVGADKYLYDNFGSLALGLLLLAIAPYCSSFSLLVAGGLSAAVLSILAVAASATATTAAPAFSFAAISAVAVLAPTAAAVAYSASIVGETLAWQRRTNAAALLHESELRTGIARSVQQSRVSVLSREVLPFLARVMTAERISVADADRARELAEALRLALKAGLESTWLDELAASLLQGGGAPVTVVDDEHRSMRLRAEQRSALTALLTWLSEEGRTSWITVAFARADEHGSRVTVTARQGSRQLASKELDPFIAVARAVGLRGEASISRENVSVEFRHDD